MAVGEEEWRRLAEVADRLEPPVQLRRGLAGRDPAGAKGATTVSVVLPARNEARTVGTIVSAIRRELVEGVPLVDEIVVIDSRSVDDTAAVAAAAGAKVFAQDAILPRLPACRARVRRCGSPWHVTSGDIVVFVDADLVNFSSSFVTGLLGPLLACPEVAYVKGCYDRPYHGTEETPPAGGGRVTELVARPLINMHWPLLAGVVQPLGGEYAGRRSLLERLPFVTGYGVELGLLVDALEAGGPGRARPGGPRRAGALPPVAEALAAHVRPDHADRVVSPGPPGADDAAVVALPGADAVPQGEERACAGGPGHLAGGGRPPMIGVREYALSFRH